MSWVWWRTPVGRVLSSRPTWAIARPCLRKKNEEEEVKEEEEKGRKGKKGRRRGRVWERHQLELDPEGKNQKLM